MNFLKYTIFITASVLLFCVSSVVGIQAHSEEGAAGRGRFVAHASTGCAPLLTSENQANPVIEICLSN